MIALEKPFSRTSLGLRGVLPPRGTFLINKVGTGKPGRTVEFTAEEFSSIMAGPLPLGNTWHAAHSDAWHVLSAGPPQGKANDVSSSPIQGRANDAGRAKDLLTINERNSTPEAGYIYLRTKKKEDLLGASGHPVRMPFAGATTESRTPCVLRITYPSIIAATWTIGYAR
ncbi:hypothetical protein CK203_075080 [Vitis vinifera]|uniref:Uncharacterized protein n=1 Tax=Vitis vinifera TaxID=29760 RepID=A0A438F9T6_VITVI|nr:hypothetical protein CK203_075080 [Vitis vinifera]